MYTVINSESMDYRAIHVRWPNTWAFLYDVMDEPYLIASARVYAIGTMEDMI